MYFIFTLESTEPFESITILLVESEQETIKKWQALQTESKGRAQHLQVPTYSHCHLLGLIFHFPRLAFIALSQQSYYYRGYFGIVTFTKKLYLVYHYYRHHSKVVWWSLLETVELKCPAQNAALKDISPLLVATLGMS